MTDHSHLELSAEFMQRVLSDGAVVDLSNRAKFRLTGADRVRYLSGQVTQAVSDVSESQALYACVTNPKGKMEGDLFIAGSDDLQSFLIDTEESLRESLFTRLVRYIIADDAELVDISDDWGLIHILGRHRPDIGIAPRASNRYGIPGNDYWFPTGAAPVTNLATLDPQALEIIRITNGIGQWGCELTPEILPPEARLESRAISYTKGCYIGQEVISRIRSVGRVNRTLERIDWVDGDPLAVGMTLFDEAEKEVGQITSAAFHPAHDDGPRWIALAFIRRGSSALGTRLAAQRTQRMEGDEIMLSSTVEVMNTPNHQPT